MKHGKKFFVGGLINLAAGLGTAGYGAYQERQAKKKMAQADAMAEGPIRSQAARQRIAKQESDAQSAIDSALRAQATAAGQIAQQGGSRALVSATPGLIRATDLASQGAIDRYGQAGAASNLAAETGMAESQNLASRLNMNRLQRAADAARTTTLSGVTGALKGAAEIVGGIDFEGRRENRAARKAERAAEAAAKKRQGIVSSTQEAISQAGEDMVTAARQDVQDSIMNTMRERRPSLNIVDEDILGGSGVYVDPMQASSLGAGKLTPDQISASGFGQSPRTLNDIADYASKVTKPRMGLKSFYDMSQFDAQKPLIEQQQEELDKITGIQPMEEGGKQDPVEKTPGEFDHDDNPIDIVQEGAKIGEMTGGEYIFNPEQAEEMRKLSEEGDSELHQFIRKLLSKEQFQ
jgi:hypothetical protein